MSSKEILKLAVVSLFVIFSIFAAYVLIKQLTQGKGDLKVETTPTGATVVLDGEKYNTPIKITDVTAGQHKVTTKKAGFKDRVDVVEVVNGKTTEVNYYLYTSEVSPPVLRLSFIEEQNNLSDFEKLLLYLPYSNVRLKIEQVVVGKEPSIKITLFAILNRPEQYEGYKLQLKEYGQEALDWIKSKGVDAKKLNISWLPKNPFKP